MYRPLTLVLGASSRSDRYSNRAVRSLRDQGHPVLAIGAREGRVHDVPILTELPPGAVVDTVTLYVGSAALAIWAERLLAMRPRRIVFNPGSENAAFAGLAEAEGIEVVEGCTLVMLAVGTY